MQESQRVSYSYESDFPIYALGWSHQPGTTQRLGIGSFCESYENYVKILQFDPEANDISVLADVNLYYPPSKLQFCPSTSAPEMFATSGAYLRIYKMDDNGQIIDHFKLVNTKGAKSKTYSAPLTSFDWNKDKPELLITSSIDTTCSIWDLNTRQQKSQLIAHDDEVYDVSFSANSDIFASCGADGSLRIFDMRNLHQSTILFENNSNPLLRISWNNRDSNFIATLPLGQEEVYILDVRVPTTPVATLSLPDTQVNALEWAPHSTAHIATAADNSMAFIWDVSSIPDPITDPLTYRATNELENLSWSHQNPHWMAVAAGNVVELLRV
ncbi:hypothetical protein PCE1_000964 [Barthelona sp. PCE]